MRADEATTAAATAADGDGAGLYKAIMLEVIFFFSLLSPSLSSFFSFWRVLITAVGRQQSQAGGRRGEAGGYRKHEGVQW